jgi:hypothetical protein
MKQGPVANKRQDHSVTGSTKGSRPARNSARDLLILAAALAMVATGCRHKPQYPEIGSLLIDSEPAGAEILVDGLTMHRSTPSRIDGLTVGAHAIMLRKFNYLDLEAGCYVKPGETTRAFHRLTAIILRRTANLALGRQANDMDLDPAAGRLYVAASGQPAGLLAFTVQDSTLLGPELLDVGGEPRRVAAGSVGGQACIVRVTTDSVQRLAVINGATGSLVSLCGNYDASGVSRLISFRGRTGFLAADSANGRLLLIDDTWVPRTIPLPGRPGDVALAPGEARAFVSYSDQGRLGLVDLASGSEVGSVAVGRDPGGLFWDDRMEILGICNRADLTLSLLTMSNWSLSTGLGEVGGIALVSGCWTGSRSNAVLLIAGSDGGGFNTVYLPTWISVKKFFVDPLTDGQPLELHRQPGSPYILVLNSRTLWLVRGNF